jgi:hypothetical protein
VPWITATFSFQGKGIFFDAFSSREPVSTSLENASPPADAGAQCEPIHRARHCSGKVRPHTRQFRAVFWAGFLLLLFAIFPEAGTH